MVSARPQRVTPHPVSLYNIKIKNLQEQISQLRNEPKKTLVLIYLDTFAYYLAKFYQVLGFEVFYLRGKGKWATDQAYEKLGNEAIRGLDFTPFKENNEYRINTIKRHYADLICEQMFYRNRQFKTLIDYFKVRDHQKRKLELLFKAEVEGDLQDIGETLTFVRELKKLNIKVIVWTPFHTFWTYILKREEGVISKNIIAKFLYLFWKLVYKEEPASNSEAVISTPTPKRVSDKLAKPMADFEVAYLPHRGVWYGDKLFLKDHYYSPNENSPYYPEKVLHILGDDDVEYHDYNIEFYEQNNISFASIKSFGGLSQKSSLIEYILLNLRSPFSYVISLLRWKFLVNFIFLKCFFTIKNYLFRLEKLPNLKVFLVGYDVLFPQNFSLALSLRGIKTIAVQERFSAIWGRYGYPAIDEYFALGKSVKDYITKNPGDFALANIHLLGCIRSQKIKESLKPFGKYEKIKSDFDKLILALDFHPPHTQDSNRLAFNNNWSILRTFYSDLIKIAETHPNVYIVFKGKNADILEIPALKDLTDKIENLKNAHIECELKEYDPYSLASICDLAVALQTSLGDDLLSRGKPVIFHLAKHYPGKFFNYNEYPVLSDNFDQLQEKIEQYLKQGHFISNQQLDEMRNEFYTSSASDYDVHGKLLSAMEQIYRDQQKNGIN